MDNENDSIGDLAGDCKYLNHQLLIYFRNENDCSRHVSIKR